MEKRFLVWLFLTLMIMMLTACGGKEENHAVGQDVSVAVAELRDIELPVPLRLIEHYSTDGNYFFATRSALYGDIGEFEYQILRSPVTDEFAGEVFISRDKADCLAMVLDRESSCFVLWKDREGGFSLEKYNAAGELQWHINQSQEEFTSAAVNFNEGAVTEEGRLVLYSYGAEGRAAVFAADGALQGIYQPELDQLEGIAVGKDNRIYAYSITGEKPLLADVEEPRKQYTLPFTPLKVFSGYEDGIYLHTAQSLWKYEPESGEAEIVWNWADEYVNLNPNEVESLFCGKEGWYLLCRSNSGTAVDLFEKTATVAAVGYESRSDYPVREPVTLGYVSGYSSDASLEELVRLYNRQGRRYYVELVACGDEEEDHWTRMEKLQLQLQKGEAPDLVEVSSFYMETLAETGDLENLTGYFSGNEDIGEASVLSAVWAGMQYQGKTIVVAPSFYIAAQACQEPVAAEEWTPRKLLEMAEGRDALWYYGKGRMDLFYACMGNDSAYPRFIDYEEKKCYFDSEEFRWILEECARVGNPESGPWSYTADSTAQEFFLHEYRLTSMEEYLRQSIWLEDSGCSWVGYPGWNGAEYLLRPDNVIAMSSASQKKEGAWDFLEFLLSEECQDVIDWGFPVRKESFETYLETSYRSEEDNRKSEEYAFFSSDFYTPADSDFVEVEYMTEHGILQIRRDETLVNMIAEEVQMYFAGDASIEETVDKLQNRVTLYLQE